MATRTDIVLVHGWAGSAESWNPVAERLAESGAFRIHAVRLPGSPGSDPASEPSVSAAADGVVRLLRELDAPAVLVGHSMGGQVTMRAHIVAADSVLTEIVVDPAYGASANSRSEMSAWADQIDADGHAAIEGFFQDAGARLSESDRRRIRSDLLATSPGAIAGYLRSEYVDEGAIGLLPASARVAAERRRPVLAVHSTMEGLAREQVLPSPRGSRIDVWAGYGHYLHLEDPVRFAALVTDWALESISAPVSGHITESAAR